VASPLPPGAWPWRLGHQPRQRVQLLAPLDKLPVQLSPALPGRMPTPGGLLALLLPLRGGLPPGRSGCGLLRCLPMRLGVDRELALPLRLGGGLVDRAAPHALTAC
jgi:hypothetical protein